MADLFEQVVKATCDRDDAFLRAKLLLRNIIKETLHGQRGKFREDMKVFLFEAAKKRKRDQQLEHTMSDGIWKEIDPNDVRFADYEVTASFPMCTSSTLTYPQTYVNSSSQTPLMLGYAMTR